MRRAPAIGALLVAGAGAAADPAYPTRLVDRAPWLPAGVTELDATTTGTHVGNSAGVLFTRGVLALRARRGFGRVEVFAGAAMRLTAPAYPFDGRLHVLDAGVLVPIDAHGAVRATLSTFSPDADDFLSEEADLAYETRLAITPHQLAFTAAAGIGFAYTTELWPPIGDLTPARWTSASVERAFVTAAFDSQATDEIAVELGTRVATTRSDRFETSADFFLRTLYAAGPLDVLVEIASTNLFRDGSRALDLVAGAAMRW